MVKRLLRWVAALGIVAAVAIQLVPYGRDHDNPPVTGEPAWDTPRTRELAVLACYDCHSNEVGWPWYSNIAPISWWVQDHVDEGRDELNFSEWDRAQEADDIVESVEEGSMPPGYFTMFGLNRDAALSRGEEDELIAGLVATFGREHEGGGERDGEDDGDEHEEDEDDGDD